MDTPLNHAGDATDAMVVINNLNLRLNEATTALGKWKIGIVADVVPTTDGFALKLNLSKENGQGFIKTITPDQVAYFASDPESLVAEVVDNVFELLLKQQIRNEIATTITRGVTNANLIQVKS